VVIFHLTTDATEEYDGTSWTNNPGGNMGTARNYYCRILWYTNSSFMFWWRNMPASPTTGATEEYDGTSWVTSNPGNMSIARRCFSRCRNANSWFRICWIWPFS
jgi:hypothetical protein